MLERIYQNCLSKERVEEIESTGIFHKNFANARFQMDGSDILIKRPDGKILARRYNTKYNNKNIVFIDKYLQETWISRDCEECVYFYHIQLLKNFTNFAPQTHQISCWELNMYMSSMNYEATVFYNQTKGRAHR